MPTEASDPPFNKTEALEKFPKILDYERGHGGRRCIAFEKYDGTNLAWRLHNGKLIDQPFIRSGRRFFHYDRVFGPAHDLFDTQFRAKLAQLLAGVEEAVFFTEYFGEKSFSGEHVVGDPKKLMAIDLWRKGFGFTAPADFALLFPETPVIYEGKLTTQFVENVRKGRLGVNEGVVCKGGSTGSVWCCKIKTDAWLARGGEA